MPSPEPNKEMEDLLRAYASRRREQGRQQLPSEMRAASRASLQNEVRRAFGAAKPRPAGVPAWRWLASYWPRLALGGGLAALLILVFVTRVPPTATRSFLPASAVSQSFDVFRVKSLGQQFVQVSNARQLQNGTTGQATVLANFQMAREGRNVIVYDADGSIYRGTVLEPAVAKDKSAFRSTFQSASRGRASRAGETGDDAAKYSFQVSGMNNNLKQNVVFTGDVLQMPPSQTPEGRAASGPPGAAADLVALDKKGGFGGQSQLASRGSSRNLPVSNSIQPGALQNQVPQWLRVTGKVKVEGGGEFEIEAQPPGP
jgi:hypothetical protein